MLSLQSGQVLPGAALYISLTAGLGLSLQPEMTGFIDQAEHVSITHAHSALKKSIEVNYLINLMSPSNEMLINGLSVKLSHGYPLAKQVELEKVADFGTQNIIEESPQIVKIWSTYNAYCFVYKEAKKEGATVFPANISTIKKSGSLQCLS